MAKVLATVAKVAGAIALVAGAVATLNPGLAVAGIALAKVAAIASIPAVSAAIGVSFKESESDPPKRTSDRQERISVGRLRLLRS